MPSKGVRDNAIWAEPFVERLRWLLQERRVSAQELSLHISNHKGTISRILRFHALPRVEVILRVAYALDVSLDWLLTGKEFSERRRAA